MLCYVYDGSFDGLLTAIYDAYYMHENPEYIVTEHDNVPALYLTIKHIAASPLKSEKVYNAILNKISREALDNIFYVYISEVFNSGAIVLNYIKLGFKYGSQLQMHMYDKRIMDVQKICRKVQWESQRMLGFLRFSCIGTNTYYAPMEPDYNILALIAPHFAERFSDQNWIIHDIKRKTAALYNKTEWILVRVDDTAAARICAVNRDVFYENLWKKYFTDMSIKTRENPRLQKQHLPVRYWKHLTEMKI